VITETRTHKIEPDITVFEISGRLNLGNLLMSVENTIRGLIDGGARKLVIDLKGLNAIDSAGIGMLVGCNGHMENSGGNMRLAGAQGPVAKVFAMVHMDRIVPMDADLTEAIAHLSAGGAAG
jgi:anti-sigma B factor antagonist